MIIHIVEQFSKQVKDILGNHLVRIIVYGSYARKDYHNNSDVDIMILVNMSDRDIKLKENDIYDAAFEIEMTTGGRSFTYNQECRSI